MNRETFIQCVTRSQESLRKFLVGVCCGDKDLADDIAQESFMKAYVASGNFSDIDNFRPWVFKIAYNTFLSHCRRIFPKENIEELNLKMSPHTPEMSFRYEELHLALRNLPERERSVVVLYYMQGYSANEIGHILDISSEAVRQALSRGRKRLKEILNGYDGK